jgi:lipoprotein-releasing system ATP-binding protein
MNASGNLVVVEQVSKQFVHEGQDVVVLQDVDLSIDEGEMVCVAGPSGAGKSTLLHLLGTLDLPSEGRIFYENQDVTRWPSSWLAEFRNRTIGFVFQFHHLLPEFTALENVMMPGLIRGERRKDVQKRAEDLLEEVGLTHRLTHRPGELSGGEQQRVALARALIQRPKLVLADEPTGNLDSKTSDAIHSLFFQLNENRGTTFLIVTHNRELASRMPRQISMTDGRVDRDERRTDGGAPYRRGGPAEGTDQGAAQESEEDPGQPGPHPEPGEAPAQ